MVLVGVAHIGDYYKAVGEIFKKEKPHTLIFENHLEMEVDGKRIEIKSDRSRRLDKTIGGAKVYVFDPTELPVRFLSELLVLGAPISLGLMKLLRLGERINRRTFLTLMTAQLAGITPFDPLVKGRDLAAYYTLKRAIKETPKGGKIMLVAGDGHMPGIERLLRDPTYRRYVEFFHRRLAGQRGD